MSLSFGLPAYSHHDRFPPWWVFVRDDNGGNLSVTNPTIGVDEEISYSDSFFSKGTQILGPLSRL